MKPVIKIEYCPVCGWLPTATYIAQELLTTFKNELQAVSLEPSSVTGRFIVQILHKGLVDPKFDISNTDIKVIKRQIRVHIDTDLSTGLMTKQICN